MTCIYEQVLVHIGEGAKAAVEAYAYLVGTEESRATGDEQRVISGQPVGNSKATVRLQCRWLFPLFRVGYQ